MVAQLDLGLESEPSPTPSQCKIPLCLLQRLKNTIKAFVKCHDNDEHPKGQNLKLSLHYICSM